jgi:hypothetical protein
LRDEQISKSNILDDVFERFVNGPKLFKDREVLRHDYLPDKLTEMIKYVLWAKQWHQFSKKLGVRTSSFMGKAELERQQ